jgi:hypothetical protein
MKGRGALFEMSREDTFKTSKALVPVTLDRCPACGTALDSRQFGQLSLFFHGGYGATRTTTTLSCVGCSWSLVVDVTETNPRTA